MIVNHEERQFLRGLAPKRLDMPPHLQAAKDKKLRAALLADFELVFTKLESAAIADRVMRVIKGERG